jgi:hypothetical protein
MVEVVSSVGGRCEAVRGVEYVEATVLARPSTTKSCAPLVMTLYGNPGASMAVRKAATSMMGMTLEGGGDRRGRSQSRRRRAGACRVHRKELRPTRTGCCPWRRGGWKNLCRGGPWWPGRALERLRRGRPCRMHLGQGHARRGPVGAR